MRNKLVIEYYSRQIGYKNLVWAQNRLKLNYFFVCCNVKYLRCLKIIFLVHTGASTNFVIYFVPVGWRVNVSQFDIYHRRPYCYR